MRCCDDLKGLDFVENSTAKNAQQEEWDRGTKDIFLDSL